MNSPFNPASGAGAIADSRVIAAAEAYLAALATGQEPDRQAFLQQYPDIAPILDRCLDGLHLVHAGTRQIESESANPSINATMTPPGSLGDFRILGEVGRGGMGVVYEAEQISLGRRVALKVLPFAAALDSRQLQRFKNEAQAAALLHHQHVVPVYAVGMERGVHYYAMQFIAGRTLEAMIQEGRELREAPLPAAATRPIAGDPTQRPAPNPPGFEAVARLAQQAALALEHAHQFGVVHRDIKPSNLLVDDRGHLWVTDFGLAQCQSLGNLTRTGDVVGTLRYMSPEQAAGQRLLLDHRTDLYSLGVTLYELLTLQPAFGGSDRQEVLHRIAWEEPLPPRRLNEAVPGELETIVLKAMAKNPDERYPTAQALADDLERFLRHEPIRAKRPTLVHYLRKWSARHRPVVVTAAVAVTLLLVIVTGFSLVTAFWLNQERNLAEHHKRLAEQRAEEVRQGLERVHGASILLAVGQQYDADHCWDDAHAAYTQAIQLHPEYTPAWVARGDLLADLGLWELAAADLDRQLELHEPDVTFRWYRHALLRQYLGDTETYCRTCRRMRDRFQGVAHALSVSEVIRASLLGPDPDADLTLLRDLARDMQAHSPHKWYERYLLGVIYYRLGEHERAAHWLEQALAGDAPADARLITYPILAMARHRLGQKAEARQALDETARTLDRWTQARYEHRQTYWVLARDATRSWPIAWWDWMECQVYYREAKQLIDGEPPPDDVRLIVQRARALAALRWVDQAAAEYAVALMRRPNDPQILLEASRNQAALYVALRDWRRAAAEFTRLSEQHPEVVHFWLYRAVAQVAAGDKAAYRATCAAILDRHDKIPDPFGIALVVETCVLTDDAVADPAQLLPLTEVAAPAYHTGTTARGAALYRAGRHAEAVRYLESAERRFRPRAWDWCFRAMAHHRLGHAEEARRCLAEAARWIEEANRNKEDLLKSTGARWAAWQERVVYPLLLREAEAVCASPAPPR